MHIITRRRFREFAVVHPDADEPLRRWFHSVKKANWPNFAAARAEFPHADQFGRHTVFNIGGNKYRLVVQIRFDRQKVYITAVLTHSEYDKGDWKD